MVGQSQAILFVQYFFLQSVLLSTIVLNAILLDPISHFIEFDFSPGCLLDILSDEDVIHGVPFPQFGHYLIELLLFRGGVDVDDLVAEWFRGEIEQFEHVRRNKIIYYRLIK